MDKPTKYSLAAVGLLVLTLAGGYLGAGFRGSSAEGATADGSWIEEIKESGKLRVGVAIAPPMTVQEGGELGGPNLIPLENLAEELGVELETVPASWNNIVAGLQADRYDAAANLDATVERAVSIQFSDPVYEYQGVFVVHADTPYKSADQLIQSKKKIAVPQGAAPAAAVAEAGAVTLELSDYTNAFQAVEAGRAEAIFADLPTAEAQVLANKGYKILVPEPEIYEAGAGYGLDEDIDARSLQLINISIAASRMSGELDRAYAEQDYHSIDDLGDMQLN